MGAAAGASAGAGTRSGAGYGRGRPGREAPLRPLKTPVLVRTAGGGAADGAVRAGRAGAVYPPAVGGIARAAGDHPGGLLLLVLALSGRVWRSARKQLSQRRITCEAAALLASLVCLGDCVYAALGYGEQLPLAAVPVISLLLCLWGQLLAAKARLAGFRLADLGGEPPYNVSVTPAGACKQQGTAEGFYRLSRQPDVSYRWQIILTPLALAAASILAAVVCFGGEGQPVRPLWIWSALLSGGLPLALPVAGTLPLSSLNRRLNRSGSAVAGYAGLPGILSAAAEALLVLGLSYLLVGFFCRAPAGRNASGRRGARRALLRLYGAAGLPDAHHPRYHLYCVWRAVHSRHHHRSHLGAGLDGLFQKLERHW